MFTRSTSQRSYINLNYGFDADVRMISGCTHGWKCFKNNSHIHNYVCTNIDCQCNAFMNTMYVDVCDVDVNARIEYILRNLPSSLDREKSKPIQKHYKCFIYKFICGGLIQKKYKLISGQ